MVKKPTRRPSDESTNSQDRVYGILIDPTAPTVFPFEPEPSYSSINTNPQTTATTGSGNRTACGCQCSWYLSIRSFCNESMNNRRKKVIMMVFGILLLIVVSVSAAMVVMSSSSNLSPIPTQSLVVSATPSLATSATPSLAPYTTTMVTTEATTESPTEATTESPTEAPTESPTKAPTKAPTESPTKAPTKAPTDLPTKKPTDSPTASPTFQCGRVDNTLPFLWIKDFGNNQGWTAEKHPRFLEDVNGDGLADIIALGNDDIEVSLSTGCDFAQPSVWGQGFGYNTGWRVGTHPRYLEDVDGDGMRDIIGFYDDGVHVSLSTGTSFTAPSRWITGFSLNNGGWVNTKYPRHVVDVDGDGKADIVGFGNSFVYVSLSTGTGFSSAAKWSSQYGYTDGWRVGTHPRYLEDVDGDGLPDVIGFYDDGVHVSLSTGTSFSAGTRWSQNYGINSGGWVNTKHPRHVADVDGDGKADIVGFGDSSVYVSLSTGTGFSSEAKWMIGQYNYNAGWRVDSNPRFVKDVDGDGKADIVGFDNEETTVSLSTGSSFTISYRVTGYGANTGWSTTKHSRILADVDGDGQCDIVGFGDAGTTVSLYE